MRNSSLLVMSIVVTAASTGLADLTDGLVAYYPFNGNANDESGQGNDGDVEGPVLVADRFGNSNRAYSFDGEDDFIGLSPIGLPTGDADRTLAAWIKTSADNDGQQWNHVFGYGNWASSEAFAMAQTGWSHPANCLAFSGFGYDLISESVINDGLWHHAVITYKSPPAGDPEMYIYLDGNQVASSYDRYLNTGTTFARIGSLGPGAVPVDGFWEGLIDDVAVWDRSLNSSEVKELYLNGIVPSDPSTITDGLVAYYPFNGNANDESGQGNDGDVEGPVLAADRFGNTNRAYLFDGEDDFIGLLPVGLPTGDADRTLAAWIKTSADNDGQQWNHVFAYGNWAQFETFAMAQTGWSHPTNCLACSGFGYDLISESVINDGLWHHAVITYKSPPAGDPEMYIYLDGNQVASSYDRYLNTGTTYARIGSLGPGAVPVDGFWEGLIDDIAVWDRSLDAAEVRELYLNGITLSDPPIITDVRPSSCPRGCDITITITGANTTFFDDESAVTRVWLSKGNVEIDAYSFVGVDATTLSADFDIPPDVNVGKWSVNVSDSVDGNLPTYADQFTVYKYPDLNEDGAVNSLDFAFFAEHWAEELTSADNIVSIPGGTFQMGDHSNKGSGSELP